MGNKQLYRQCKMEKQTDNGKLVHTAWIPSQFAKVGKNISLLQNPANREGGITGGGSCIVDTSQEYWDHGWVVVEAGDSLRDQDDANRQRDAQKRWESVLK